LLPRETKQPCDWQKSADVKSGAQAVEVVQLFSLKKENRGARITAPPRLFSPRQSGGDGLPPQFA